MSLPPLYEEVIGRHKNALIGVLVLLAPSLEPTDLAACTRVCKAWHEIVLPLLWANPIRVLATKDNPFCEALNLITLWTVADVLTSQDRSLLS